MSDRTLAAYLAQHPKMTGVLFTTLLLVSQTGGALAARSTGYPGP